MVSAREFGAAALALALRLWPGPALTLLGMRGTGGAMAVDTAEDDAARERVSLRVRACWMVCLTCSLCSRSASSILWIAFSAARSRRCLSVSVRSGTGDGVLFCSGISLSPRFLTCTGDGDRYCGGSAAAGEDTGVSCSVSSTLLVPLPFGFSLSTLRFVRANRRDRDLTRVCREDPSFDIVAGTLWIPPDAVK